jgi:prevent-host-death family protein
VARLSATDVARRFSEVLNRVAAGEEIEITRAGAPVAVIAPPRVRLMDATRFRELIETAPPLDDDFAADLRGLRAAAGPRENPWPS